MGGEGEVGLIRGEEREGKEGKRVGCNGGE